MRDKPENRGKREPDPFDGEAITRLRDMGLAGGDGAARPENMAAFTAIFAGLFFGDTRDFYHSTNEIATIYKAFSALRAKEQYHHMYLLYSLQYDYLRKPLPDPVWWIAGAPELIAIYMDGFVTRFGELCAAAGILDADNGERDHEAKPRGGKGD